jgi:Protein of unknown function (DUF2510)
MCAQNIASPPANWYEDPLHRHEFRYWDGSVWTEHVADQGQASVDTIPAPPRAQGIEEIVSRVAYLVGYLRPLRATPERLYEQPEYRELLRVGHDLNERGGLDLMRSVAHQMAPRVTAPPNPYVGDQVTDSLSDINGYWNGIGDWQA